MQNHDERNIKWDQGRIIDMGPVSRDPTVNVVAQERKCSTSLFAETWTKRCLNEVEVQDLPLYMAVEDIKSLREIVILE